MNQKQYALLCEKHNNNLDNIINDLVKMSAIDPDDMTLSFHLGFTYFIAKRYETAIAQLSHAIDYAVNHRYHLQGTWHLEMLANLYTCRSDCFSKMTLKSEAINDFILAARHSARVFLLQDKIENSLKCYKAILKLKPDDIQALEFYGALIYKQFRNEKLTLKKSTKKSRHMSTKKLDEAIDHYKKIIALEPTDLRAYSKLVTIYRQESKIFLAFKMINRCMEIAPTQPMNYVERARVHLLNKEPSKFHEDMKRAFQLDEKIVSKLFNNEIILLIPFMKKSAPEKTDVIASLEKLADEKKLKYSTTVADEKEASEEINKENNAYLANVKMMKQAFKIFKPAPYKQQLKTIPEDSVLTTSAASTKRDSLANLR